MHRLEKNILHHANKRREQRQTELKEVERKIKYYQNNKEQFFKDCLGSDENERQYLYDEWIEEFFMSSHLEFKKN